MNEFTLIRETVKDELLNNLLNNDEFKDAVKIILLNHSNRLDDLIEEFYEQQEEIEKLKSDLDKIQRTNFMMWGLMLGGLFTMFIFSK